MLVRPLMTNFKMIVRDVSACSPPPHSIHKCSHSLLVSGGVGLWTDVCQPPPRLPASEIKQTFLSPNLSIHWLLGVKQPEAIHLSVTIGGIWLNFPGGPVAKTLCSQCRGAWVQSLVRELNPTCCNPVCRN